MKKNNCINCKFLTAKLGRGKYLIYKCRQWGLMSQRIIPGVIIFQSIGKKCPFYEEKKKKGKLDKQNNGTKPVDNDSDLDIIV